MEKTPGKESANSITSNNNKDYVTMDVVCLSSPHRPLPCALAVIHFLLYNNTVLRPTCRLIVALLHLYRLQRCDGCGLARVEDDLEHKRHQGEGVGDEDVERRGSGDKLDFEKCESTRRKRNWNSERAVVVVNGGGRWPH